MLTAQQRQQAMLSDQAADNATKQFNATSDMQTDQFMASLASTIAQNNSARADAMTQFNNTQTNTIAAQNVGNALEAERLQDTMNSQIEQFNSQLAFQKDQFNVQNAVAIEQSNVNWRRQTNTANTAGVNAVNQANAMNAFNLSNQGLSFLWQEMRDAAKWEYEAAENDDDRNTKTVIAALGNEAIEDQTRVDKAIAIANWAKNLF
jgi:flagellar biosynthesis chaperone FliJ